MSQSRLPYILGGIVSIFVAIAASVLLSDSGKFPQLYCVSPSSNYFITTLNESLPRAKCFQVENGLFSEIFEELPEAEGRVQWLDGFVLPGIIESHGHMLQYGEMLESVSLYDSKSVVEMRERVKIYLKTRKGEGWGTKEKWVRGVGWDQKFFGGVMPTAEEISDDPELKDLYIMLDRVDVHCVLISNKVLDLLPSPLPKPPPGGMVVTDPGPGVFCDNAMEAFISPLAPKPDKVQKKRWFKEAMAELNKIGIVGAGDAGMRPTDVAILEEMAEEDELTLRIKVMLECAERNTFCPDETKDLRILENEKVGWLMLGGVKLFSDGALGSWGAALLEPYSDKETSGSMLINETELTKVVKQWYDFGLQVNVHAIGDRANRAAVDAFENVLGIECHGCNDARRLRIEHAQIIHPDDQKRIEKMGIIPSIQPTHATSDMAYAFSRLGSKRLSESAYRMKSFFPTTKTLYRGPVLGSDYPVEPPNPFHGMYAAVTRLNPATGTSPSGDGGWHAEEALSVKQAVLGFTRNGAYGWMQEGKAGAIEVGKWADWVVIDRNIWLDESGKSLRHVAVKETWVGGRKVFGNEKTEESEGWSLWLGIESAINQFRLWIRRQAAEEL